jgi:serine/threonine-protein kinase
MSPEQCAGNEDVGPASDVYGVAALGYYLLTGQVLFSGRSSIQMLAAHLYETPKLLSGRGVIVSGQLEATIARCLAKDPGERYSSAGAVQEALLRCDEAGRWTEGNARAWWQQTTKPL